MNLAAAELVHQRSGVLRRVHSSLQNPFFEAYPDLFGIWATDESFPTKVGLAEKLKHIY